MPHRGGFIARYYELIGMERHLRLSAWGRPGPEMPLSQTPYDMVGRQGATYGYFFGADFGQRPGLWLVDPWGKNLEGAPIAPEARAELLRWRAGADAAGARPRYEGDEVSRRLDTITLEDHMIAKHRISRETMRTFLSPVRAAGMASAPTCSPDIAAMHPGRSTRRRRRGSGRPDVPRRQHRLCPADREDVDPRRHPGPAAVEAVCPRRRLPGAGPPRAATRIRLRSTVMRVEHAGAPERAATC